MNIASLPALTLRAAKTHDAIHISLDSDKAPGAQSGTWQVDDTLMTSSNNTLLPSISKIPIQSTFPAFRAYIIMPFSKTPGGQAASDKFMKQEAQKHGEGASNAPGHTDGKEPGEAPVASDSGISSVGIERGTNQPGEKGDVGAPVLSIIPDNLKETKGVEESK